MATQSGKSGSALGHSSGGVVPVDDLLMAGIPGDGSPSVLVMTTVRTRTTLEIVRDSTDCWMSYWWDAAPDVKFDEETVVRRGGLLPGIQSPHGSLARCGNDVLELNACRRFVGHGVTPSQVQSTHRSKT